MQLVKQISGLFSILVRGQAKFLFYVLMFGFVARGFSDETNFSNNLQISDQRLTTTNVATNFSTKLSEENHIGWWIWDDQTYDQQTCRFWRAFEIPRSSTVANARIRMTADNSYRLFLDGREIGKGGEWRSLNEFNVTPLLGPGPHVLAIEAFSDYSAAGMIFGLQIELENGRTLEILSDKNWRIVPEGEEKWESRKTASANWPLAKVIAPYGEAHWKQTSTRIIQGPSLRPVVLAFWQKAWFQITLLSVLGAAILVSVYLMSRLAMQSKAQELLQRERARIARDIHDDLGASLTQLVLLGEVAQNDLPPKSETRRQIDGLCEKAREVLRSAEEIIWMVNSRRDTLSDFATYVCKYAQNFLNPTSIRCRLEIEPSLPAIPFDLPIRRNLFLAVKEAINNAAKYSEASELFLRIHRRGQNIVVVVEDNGKGFDPLLADAERNGLTNMAQRMNEVNGSCRVTSSSGSGCHIEFVAPLSSQQKGFLSRREKRDSPDEKTRNATVASQAALQNRE